MPVADDYYHVDPEKMTKMFAKMPSHIQKAQKIPTTIQKEAIGKILLYNGLWVSLTYGADLIGLFMPWLGKGIKALIDLRFKGKWEQKQIGDNIKKIIDK